MVVMLCGIFYRQTAGSIVVQDKLDNETLPGN